VVIFGVVFLVLIFSPDHRLFHRTRDQARLEETPDMSDPNVIDITALRRNRPQLFRSPGEMAQMRLEVEANAMAAPNWAAYAPDPDRDYREGLRDGAALQRREDGAEIVSVIRRRRQPRFMSGPRILLIVALILAVYALKAFQ
jgi:hypothetical protein